MRWGIVGFGWVARDFMAPGIVAAGHTIAAACDRNPGAREAAARLGASTHADLERLLAARPDAIYVATPQSPASRRRRGLPRRRHSGALRKADGGKP